MLKGTAVLTIRHTAGAIIAASTHGARAGTESVRRVEQFKEAAQYISEEAKRHGRVDVIWGGDFNMRRHLEPSDVLTLERYGFTHPTPDELTQCRRDGNSCVDRHSHLVDTFDPTKVVQHLSQIPDWFGGHGDTRITTERLLEQVRLEYDLDIVGVDVNKLCPSYYKADLTYNKWIPDSDMAFVWSPRLACQACPDCPVEYYGGDPNTW